MKSRGGSLIIFHRSSSQVKIMVANVSPLNAAQNSSPAHRGSLSTGTNSGPSFASMLSNEINSAKPAQATGSEGAAARAHEAKTADAVGSQNGTADSASGKNATNAAQGAGHSAASGHSGKTGKKIGKSDGEIQTDAETSASQAAAIAATLAAAAGLANSNGGSDPTSAPAAAGSLTIIHAASTDDMQPGSQAANLVADVASGKPQDLGAKTPISNLPTGGADGKPQAAPVMTQNAVAAISSALSSSAEKSSQQSAGDLAKEIKTADAASTTSTPANPAAIASAGDNSTSGAGAQIAPLTQQSIKTASQDLSIQQQNAIAPVLTLPPDIDPGTPASAITPHVGSPAWDQAVGQKISWMVSGGQHSATLTLNPPDLGPMQVVLSVNKQHASATFVSHQPEVRAALENAIPKLREMMGQSGIQLGDCNVNSQAQQQSFNQQQAAARGAVGSVSGANGNVGGVVSEAPAIIKTGLGLVDTFV